MPRNKFLLMLGLIAWFAGPTSICAEEELAKLKEQVASQQKQIDELRAALDRVLRALPQAAEDNPTAATNPVLPHGQAISETAPAPSTPAAVAPIIPLPPPAEMPQYTQKMDGLEKKLDETIKNFGGFKFGGDFRLRFDAIARSGNSVAPPLQNIRARYRLRMNVDKELDPRFRFHMQLSTGQLNNGLTNDQDFGSTVVKHPFFISEAYVDFHPNSTFSLRGGRMEEIFADNTRFLWDDDVRFNGFHQVVKLPLGANSLGFKTFEFRAAEYILSNPNVVILSATSPFVDAGYQPGKKVGSANLLHPGFVLGGALGSKWTHQITSDVQLYRNPNQIQLSGIVSGFPVVVSNTLGILLSGPMTGTGNAVTAPGGAVYNAPHFQIVRAAYRVEHPGFHLGDRGMPFWLDFQATRNTGTSTLRDAFMVSANLGAVKKAGDVRFLYQVAFKDANSLIAQFTDDELGIGSGVNIFVQAARFDLGLTRFLHWQNLFFVQRPRRPSNPTEQFFVPLQPGANTAFRYQGQLAFTF